MRKIYRYLIAAAVAAAFALTLGACEAPHVESEQENAVGLNMLMQVVEKIDKK